MTIELNTDDPTLVVKRVEELMSLHRISRADPVLPFDEFENAVLQVYLAGLQDGAQLLTKEILK